MDWDLSRTGIDDAPSEPFIVSCEILGMRDSAGKGPPLAGTWQRGRDCLHRIRDRHNSLGWRRSDFLELYRYTVEGQRQPASHTDGRPGDGWWEETVTGMGETYDIVGITGAYSWGQVDWRAPVLGRYFGPDESDAFVADVTSPAAALEDDCLGWLEVLSESANVKGVHTGYVHPDSIADPYGKVVTECSRVSEDDFRSSVHGYYWAVLLTEGHLERLGGRKAVLAGAPCERVEDVGEAGREAVLCVLTRSPQEMDSDRVKRWRQFLLPVLRPGYPGCLEYVGRSPGERIPLTRPVWLFEGTPTPGGLAGDTMGALLGGRLPEPPGSVPTAMPMEWATDPATGAFSALAVDLGPAFSEERHLAVVEAVVRAWEMTAQLRKLPEVPDIALGRVEDVAVRADERSIDVRLSNPMPTAAMERLGYVLSGLAGFLKPDDPISMFVGLRVS